MDWPNHYKIIYLETRFELRADFVQKFFMSRIQRNEEAYGRLQEDDAQIDVDRPDDQQNTRTSSPVVEEEEKKKKTVLEQLKNINVAQIRWVISLAKGELWLLFIGSIALLISSGKRINIL